MTNGQPPRRPPPLPPPLNQVRPIEERYAPPPGQRTAPRHPGQPPQHAPPAHDPGQQPHHPAHRHSGRPGTPSRPPMPPAGRRPPPSPPRSGLGGTLLVASIGIGVIAAAGAAFVLLSPPTDLIREQAIALVKERTGRDLAIRGPASFTFYPSVGVSLKDVTLSAPPGMNGPPTVAMESLEISVRLMPLLSRRVEVRRLVLTRPTFDLRVDKAGRRSWDLAAHIGGSGSVRLAQAAGSATTLSDAQADAPLLVAQNAAPSSRSQAGHDRLAALKDVVLRDVRVIDGSLTYSDARTAAVHNASVINMAMNAPTLSSPMTAKGDLQWQGQTIRFDGTLTSLYEVLTETPAKIALSVSSAPLKADYTGAIDLRQGASLDGTVAARSNSLRALALWLGKPLPENDGFGPLNLTGRLKTRQGTFQLANADISLDQMRVTGSIDGTTSGARPHVKADLKISELNLNTYLGGSATASSHRPSLQPPAADGGNASTRPIKESERAPPQSIEDLLERQQSGPRVKGYTARSGWSDEPIDVALLNIIDADAKLSIGRLIVRDIKVDQASLTLALKNAVAKTLFDRVDLYGGTGRGQIDIDASTRAPTIAARLVVDGVSAEPLLQDAASVDWLSGKGKLTLATTSSGATQRQLVSALHGKADFEFTDGAVRGFNVAKAIRGLQQGRLTGLSSTPSEKTDFSQLTASFDIVNGVATNQDLTMVSPLLRITGHGSVMLPDRNIDYTFNPKLVADLSGQGGNTGLTGIQVPIRIVGPWDRPNIAPDLSKIDAKEAAEAVEQIGKRFKGKNADEVVDELLGKDTKEGQKAKKFLDKFFR